MYCKPYNVGLSSEEAACKRTIIKILKVLEEVEGRFETPPVRNPFFYHPDNEGLSFEYDCMIFRQKLWDRIQTDYKISVGESRIKLTKHKEPKQ
jgi:hypothetical protein